MITNSVVFGQRTVGTTAVQLQPTPNVQVRGTTLTTFGALVNTGIIYIGDSPDVTTSTGFPMPADRVILWPTNNIASIWVIADAADQKLGYVGG